MNQRRKALKWNFYHFSRITVIDGKTSRFSNFSHLIGFNIEKSVLPKNFLSAAVPLEKPPACCNLDFWTCENSKIFLHTTHHNFSPKYPCHLWIGLLELNLKKKPCCAHEVWSILLPPLVFRNSRIMEIVAFIWGYHDVACFRQGESLLNSIAAPFPFILFSYKYTICR